jgi:hypothetical protein
VLPKYSLVFAAALADMATWFLWNKDVGLKVVDLLFFSNCVDGRRQDLGPR